MVLIFSLLGGIIGFFISREVNIMVDFKSILDLVCGIPLIIMIIIGTIASGGMMLLLLPFYVFLGVGIYDEIVKNIPTINMSFLIIVAGLFLGAMIGGLISSWMHPKPNKNPKILLPRFKRSTPIGIIYMMCGLSILVGYFIFPFIKSDKDSLLNYFDVNNGDVLSFDELRVLFNYLTTKSTTIEEWLNFAEVIVPVLTLIFAIIGLWCLMKAAGCFFGTYKGKPVFWVRLFRFISALTIFFIIPVSIILGFYFFELGYLDKLAKHSQGYTIRLRDIQLMFDTTQPDIGFWLILIPCLFAGSLSVIRIIVSAYQPVPQIQYHSNGDVSYSYPSSYPTATKPVAYVPFINIPKPLSQSELKHAIDDANTQLKRQLELNETLRQMDKLLRDFETNQAIMKDFKPPVIDLKKINNKK